MSLFWEFWYLTLLMGRGINETEQSRFGLLTMFVSIVVLEK